MRKGKKKPYQQDREELELVQQLYWGRVTARPEYWGECTTETLPESVQVRKENKGVMSW